jgi:hypothetical protein
MVSLSNHEDRRRFLSSMLSLSRVALSVLAVVALLTFGRAAAEEDIAKELEAAGAALAAGDYEAAFEEYTRFAEEEGNPLAQFTLALFYQLGWGRPVDPVKACQWHEKAAEARIPAAQHYLGDCLVAGTHRLADPAAAAVWYARAAEDGHAISLCGLAELYIAGNGVPKDPGKGLAYCRQAAEQGLVPAQIRMGKLLLDGDEEIRDPEAAYGWFEVAANRESPEAQHYLGLMTRDGLGRPKDPGAALHWFERAASQGHVPAYLPTGALYFAAPVDPETGLPSAENLAKAYLWLSAIAERSRDPEELAEAAAMLERIRAVMPTTWVPDLDRKLADHLAEHPVP